MVGALEFDDPAAPDLKAAQGGPATTMRDGVLEVVSDPDDYLENAVALAVPRDEIGDLVIRMKADKGTYLRLAWTSAEGPSDGKIWRAKLDVRFIDNQDFHTYVVNARDVMRRGLRQGENLGHLYIQPADVAGAKVELDYIRFISKASRYAAASRGVDYETHRRRDAPRRVHAARPGARVRAQGPRAASPGSISAWACCSTAGRCASRSA